MAASITVHLQIFKRPQFPYFSTDLDETGIKIHGLLISFIQNIVIIRVAVPFKKQEAGREVRVNPLNPNIKMIYTGLSVRTVKGSKF